MEANTIKIILISVAILIIILGGLLAAFLDNHEQFKDSPQTTKTYFKTVHNNYDIAKPKEVTEHDDWDFYIEIDENNVAVRYERE